MGEMWVWPADPPPQSNGILPGTICTIRKHLVIHNIIYEVYKKYEDESRRLIPSQSKIKVLLDLVIRQKNYRGQIYQMIFKLLQQNNLIFLANCFKVPCIHLPSNLKTLV